MDFTASPADLAATIRKQAACRHLDAARRLASWVGESRQVTSTGVPRPADAVAAATACGLALPARKVTRAAQISGLVALWELALATGMLGWVGSRVTPGENADCWPDGADLKILEMWLRGFAQLFH